jgi:hypothetical protein
VASEHKKMCHTGNVLTTDNSQLTVLSNKNQHDKKIASFLSPAAVVHYNLANISIVK